MLLGMVSRCSGESDHRFYLPPPTSDFTGIGSGGWILADGMMASWPRIFTNPFRLESVQTSPYKLLADKKAKQLQSPQILPQILPRDHARCRAMTNFGHPAPNERVNHSLTSYEYDHALWGPEKSFMFHVSYLIHLIQRYSIQGNNTTFTQTKLFPLLFEKYGILLLTIKNQNYSRFVIHTLQNLGTLAASIRPSFARHRDICIVLE